MVDFPQWPMADFLQRFKPREHVYHASLPFQGKSWGMGSKKEELAAPLRRRSPDARFLPRLSVNSTLAVHLQLV